MPVGARWALKDGGRTGRGRPPPPGAPVDLLLHRVLEETPEGDDRPGAQADKVTVAADLAGGRPARQTARAGAGGGQRGAAAARGHDRAALAGGYRAARAPRRRSLRGHGHRAGDQRPRGPGAAPGGLDTAARGPAADPGLDRRAVGRGRGGPAGRPGPGSARDGRLSPAGRDIHATLEIATDQAAARPWACLGPAAVARLDEALTPVAQACARAVPYPSPIGVPAPGTGRHPLARPGRRQAPERPAARPPGSDGASRSARSDLRHRPNAGAGCRRAGKRVLKAGTGRDTGLPALRADRSGIGHSQDHARHQPWAGRQRSRCASSSSSAWATCRPRTEEGRVYFKDLMSRFLFAQRRAGSRPSPRAGPPGS